LLGFIGSVPPPTPNKRIHILQPIVKLSYLNVKSLDLLNLYVIFFTKLLKYCRCYDIICSISSIFCNIFSISFFVLVWTNLINMLYYIQIVRKEKKEGK